MLAELAAVVTETPWALSPAHHARATAAGLTDAELLHAIALSSYFGHLNRIADAVAVALDYDVLHAVPHAEPATPPYDRAPAPPARTAAPMAIEARPATAAAMAAWHDYVVARDPRSTEIAAWVAALLGDGEPAVAEIATAAATTAADTTAEATALRRLVEQVTLAPWQLTDEAFAPLRALGHDDAALFRVCSAASTFGVASRLRVALAALAG